MSTRSTHKASGKLKEIRHTLQALCSKKLVKIYIKIPNNEIFRLYVCFAFSLSRNRATQPFTTARNNELCGTNEP